VRHRGSGTRVRHPDADLVSPICCGNLEQELQIEKRH
jgi:hypothetical protein